VGARNDFSETGVVTPSVCCCDRAKRLGSAELSAWRFENPWPSEAFQIGKLITSRDQATEYSRSACFLLYLAV